MNRHEYFGESFYDLLIGKELSVEEFNQQTKRLNDIYLGLISDDLIEYIGQPEMITFSFNEIKLNEVEINNNTFLFDVIKYEPSDYVLCCKFNYNPVNNKITLTGFCIES